MYCNPAVNAKKIYHNLLVIMSLSAEDQTVLSADVLPGCISKCKLMLFWNAAGTYKFLLCLENEWTKFACRVLFLYVSDQFGQNR